MTVWYYLWLNWYLSLQYIVNRRQLGVMTGKLSYKNRIQTRNKISLATLRNCQYSLIFVVKTVFFFFLNKKNDENEIINLGVADITPTGRKINGKIWEMNLSCEYCLTFDDLMSAYTDVEELHIRNAVLHASQYCFDDNLFEIWHDTRFPSG